MQDDKDVKQILIECGREEFLLYGYNKASLRNICKRGNVTTGALYFFFKDKEDLFSYIVSKPISNVISMIEKHYKDELKLYSKTNILNEEFDDDFKLAEDVIRYMYKNRPEIVLALTKAQGSKYENIVDKIVEVTQKHYKMLTETVAKQLNKEPLDEYFIHWFSHMQTDVFIHVIIHEEDEEKAVKYVKETILFLRTGWDGFIKMY